jgi:FkbM family methyltransferase
MYYSQDKQDEILHKQLFKTFEGGFFVDVGANDGVRFNNTLFFEKNLKWKGINIEPLKLVFEQLKINRPHAINLRVAVDTKDGEAEFMSNSGSTEMLSGLVQHYETRHKERLDNENVAYGGLTDIVRVKTRTLKSIFEEYKVAHIHYLSIDVEGAEMAVLQSIDFEKVFIDCIGFENNYGDRSPEIISFLESKGFKECHRGGLDIFMLHSQSKFTFNK